MNGDNQHNFKKNSSMNSSSIPESPKMTAKTTRQSQADRTRAMQDKLMNATIEVLLKQGYSRLTTKEVARIAGVSNGALMHHFSSKAELVVAATAMVYEEAISRGQKVANTSNADKKPIEGYLADCLSVYFEWPFIAALETIIVARTDHDLMEKILPVMKRYRSVCDEIWLSVFIRSGISNEKSRLLMNLTLNLVRGMAVNQLWRRDEKNHKRLLKQWIAIATREIQHKKIS
jgi:AcrR family transcriptional regulator